MAGQTLTTMLRESKLPDDDLERLRSIHDKTEDPDLKRTLHDMLKHQEVEVHPKIARPDNGEIWVVPFIYKSRDGHTQEHAVNKIL